MVEFGEHTVPDPCLGVVRVARLVGFGVVDVMGYDIDLLGKGPYDQVLRNDTPYGVAEAIRFMRAIPVKPDRAMRPHDDHTVNDNRDDVVPGDVFGQKQDKKRQQADKRQKAEKRDPVLAGLEDIDPGPGLGPELFICGNDQSVVMVFPAVGRFVQDLINERGFGHNRYFGEDIHSNVISNFIVSHWVLIILQVS
jgi:hypothetical protein